MKIATISDPHVGIFSAFGGGFVSGLNVRSGVCLDTLSSSLEQAVDMGCDVFVINGDLFETSHPEAALLNAVARIFAKYSRHITIIAMPGNHDMVSTAPGNNACAMLGFIENVHVPEKPQVSFDGDAIVLSIPFETGRPAEWLPKRLEALDVKSLNPEGKPVCLSLHMGLNTKRTPANLAYHAGAGAYPAREMAALANKHGISRVFLGDWHHPDDYTKLGVGLHQVGTLCPSDFRYSMPDVGQMIVWDTRLDEVNRYWVPGPRWVDASSLKDACKQLEEHEDSNDDHTALYVRVKCTAEMAKEVEETIRGSYEITGFSVNVDNTRVKAEVRAAAARASGANTVDGAAKAFLNEYPMADTVDRAEVRTKVLGFLTRASGGTTSAASEVRVTHISVGNFMSSDRIEVELPKTGKVLVTGKNGHGKSTLIEAVCTGLYGKSIRGESGWRLGAAGGVEITTPKGTTKRTCSASGTKKLHHKDAGGGEYTTTKKAQAALSALYGDDQLWRRTSVFAGADMARFSISTDKERKTLLETVLGLSRFDGALKACRAELSDAKASLSSFMQSRAVCNQQLTGLASELAVANRALGDIQVDVDLPQLRMKHAELTAEVGTLTDQEAKDQWSRDHWLRRQPELVRKIAETEATLRELLTGECQACGQKLPKKVTEVPYDPTQGEDELHDYKKELSEFGSCPQIDHERCQKLTVLNRELAQIDALGRAASQAQTNTEKWQKKCHELGDAVAECRRTLKQRDTEFTDAANTVAILSVCDKALGLKGIRAHILSGALSGLEAVSNMWLSRLVGPRATVSIIEESDKIKFDVKGYGGGRGYKAASEGEKRRVDLSLLLAIGELSRATCGAKEATLWLDEVFDSLDTEGVESALVAVDELAEDRCVIIITHNKEIKARINPTLHLEAVDGKLHEAS